MNQVVIFFVPTGAAQRDFETALREHFESLQIGEAPPQAKADRAPITDNDQMPLWTWFVPNSCR
jgi:hypothetical protein